MKRKVIHDEVTFLTAHLEEECFIADDVGVLQLFDINEILLQKDDVFSIYLKGFSRKKFTWLFAVTFSYHSMCPFSYLIPHGKMVVEKRII